MSPSIQTLIDEFKNAVFAQVDLEYQDNLTLIELLPHLVNQDSKSDVKDKFRDFQEWTVYFKKKAIDWQVERKMKEVELKKYEIDFRGMSRPTALCANSGFRIPICQFRIPLNGWEVTFLMEECSKKEN